MLEPGLDRERTGQLEGRRISINRDVVVHPIEQDGVVAGRGHSRATQGHDYRAAAVVVDEDLGVDGGGDVGRKGHRVGLARACGKSEAACGPGRQRVPRVRDADAADVQRVGAGVRKEEAEIRRGGDRPEVEQGVVEGRHRGRRGRGAVNERGVVATAAEVRRRAVVKRPLTNQ